MLIVSVERPSFVLYYAASLYLTSFNPVPLPVQPTLNQ